MSEYLPRIAQPWTDHPLHRETTYSLSIGAMLDKRAAKPIPTDATRAAAEDYARFLDALSEDRALAVRRGDVTGDDIMQWYAEYGSMEREEDTPDGPREEQSE